MSAQGNLAHRGATIGELLPHGNYWSGSKRLVLLADLVKKLADARCISPWQAAENLVAVLGQGRLPMFAAQKDFDSLAVAPDHVWRAAAPVVAEGWVENSVQAAPEAFDRFSRSIDLDEVPRLRWRKAKPAQPQLAGPDGLVKLLGELAPNQKGGVVALLSLPLGRLPGALAVPWADACAVFNLMEAECTQDSVKALPPEALGQAAASQFNGEVHATAGEVIQPEGGAWPHQEKNSWSKAERAALFEMRHRLKFTGKRLAEIAGTTRQRIDEVIGKARPGGGPCNAKAKDGWEPSRELLQRCNLPLQPLQSTVASLCAA